MTKRPFHPSKPGLLTRLVPAGLGLLLLLAAGALPAAAAGNPNPGVLPPHANAYGHSYGEWSALWWRWVTGIPWDQNPVVDTTGEFAATGQSGPVWFLAGTFGGSANRTAVVPAGKGLFFPIINEVWITTCVGEPRTIDGIRPFVAPSIDAVESVSVEIDGVALRGLERHRAESPLFCAPLDIFGITSPADLEGSCPDGVAADCMDLPIPAEHFGPDHGFGPAMSDGYWVMLAPLAAGDHMIHFTATRGGEPVQDVTYHLTVK